MIEYATFDRMIGTSVGTYRLEQLVGQARGGPIFLARSDAGTYLLHLLTGPNSMASRDRQVYLAEGQRVSVPVFDRARLSAGTVLPSPSIAVQLDSTTFIPPHTRATVDPSGSIVLELI